MPPQAFQGPFAHQALHYPGPAPMAMAPYQSGPMDDHRQRVLHSQWDTRIKMLHQQLDYMQSPEDEAGMERFSQELQELRRLSQEARRG